MTKQALRPLLLAFSLFVLGASPGYAATSAAESVQVVTQMPGLVAFWEFVKREPSDPMRFTAHVPAGATTEYPLDAANYIKDYWSTAQSGGIFTIGRVIHSGRSVGFTGWIGGVAVFNRALDDEELAKLSALRTFKHDL